MDSFETREYELYLFDLDDTLTRSKSGEKFPKTVDDRELIPGRWERLLDLAKANKKTAIVSNQGGAAWGIFDGNEMTRFLTRMAESAELGAVFVCYHDSREKARNNPKTIAALTEVDRYKEWDRRKPGPGMIYEAMDFFQVEREQTLMIGDREEDKGAAEAAGISFEWAWDFFKEGPIIV